MGGLQAFRADVGGVRVDAMVVAVEELAEPNGEPARGGSASPHNIKGCKVSNPLQSA